MIKEGDIVKKLPSKRVPKKLPPYDVSAEIRWHVKKIMGREAIVDRYLDDEKNARNLLGLGNETILLAKIADDTVYEIIKEQIFPPLAQLDTAKKVWTPLPRLYVDVAAAQAALGVTEITELHMTTNGKYYIADDVLVPKAK